MAEINTEEERGMSFPDLIRQRTRTLTDAYDDAHYGLTSDYVTLTKRNQGDYLGTMNSKHRNLWNPVLTPGFVTYPVIPRAIRAKLATAVATDVLLDIKSALERPTKKAAATLCQNIYEYEVKYHWTERVEAMIALLGMTGRFCGLMLTQPDDKQITVATHQPTKKSWIESKSAVIGCQDCGATYLPEHLGLKPIGKLAQHADPDDPSGNPLPDEAEQLLEKQRSDAGGAHLGKTQKIASPDGLYDPRETIDKSSSLNPSDPTKANTSTGTHKSHAPDFDGFNAETGEPETDAASAEQTPDGAQYDLSNAKCLNPDCSKQNGLGITTDAEFEEHDVDDEDKEEEIIQAAMIELTTISALLIRFDDLHTIGFDWQKAHWMNYHPLETRYEILANHPELKDTVASSGNGCNPWSNSARWYYELGKQNGNIGTVNTAQSNAYAELVEPNYWWFQPIMCHNWTSPDEWALKRNGEVVFQFQIGETIEQAFERTFQKPFAGCKVKLVGDEISEIDNISFLHELLLFGWNPDHSSHVPMGEERLIPLQDAATRILSMCYSGVQKMTQPKGVADWKLFDKADLNNNQPGKWLTTKPSADFDERGGNILQRIGYITPPNPSSFVDMFVQLIIQIAKEESGIFDETVGNANPQNVTKGGRELALNQSLGLMASTQKAKKDGKIAWARASLKKWQQMPDEAFTLIKGEWEEEWKPEDIRAFRKLNIDHELLITAVEGSDVPKTDSGQTENIMIAAQLGLLSEQPPFDVEVCDFILKNVLGISLDVGNRQADRRLAERRHEAMREIVMEYATNQEAGFSGLIEIAMDEMTGLPSKQLVPALKMQIAQDIRTKVYQEDNHAVFIGYYVDQLKGISGSREPSEIQILVLEFAIDSHNQMLAQKSANLMKANAIAGAAAGVAAQAGAPIDPAAASNQGVPPA